MWRQQTISIATPGRGSYDMTGKVQAFVSADKKALPETGLCHVFVCHTSASLLLCEDADPQVRDDLERFMARTVPDGDPRYHHTMEGPDDMPAHIRSVLTTNDLTLPVSSGRLVLGTWQGIYLWEHRLRPHQRQVILTLHGR